jgi:HK97 family phage prohead protease
MAYLIKGKSGQPVLAKDGKMVLGSDITDVKLLDLDEKEGTFVARASSKKEDRDRDIIHQEGFDLKNFKKNPVIPWSHNYWEPPVAKSVKTWVDGDLMFQPKFDMNDEFAVKIFNKYKNGFLTSFSVGFIGQEFQPRDEKDPWFGGREFTKVELLEISCVTVPANPNANVHVNAMDGGVKSLVDAGFPNTFARTKTGLFYPIRDLNEFTDPVEMRAHGLVLVSAKTISDKHPEAGVRQLVGVSLPPDATKEQALEAVKLFSNEKRKVWAFKLEGNKEGKGIDIIEVVEELPIASYTEPVEMGEKSPSESSMASYRVVGEKTIEDEVVKPEDEGQVPPVDPPEKKKEVSAEVVLTVSPEVNEFKSTLNEFVQSVKTVFDGINGAVSLIKESVDLLKKPCDNKTIEGGQPTNGTGEVKDGDDDQIEFAESLLTPEGKTVDSVSDQIVIEIQDAGEIGTLAKSAGESVARSLGKTLIDAMKKSGRID